MRRRAGIYFLAALLWAEAEVVCPALGMAQEVVERDGVSVPAVVAGFDRDSIMIGEQFRLEAVVEKDLMQMVDFPSLVGAEIAPGVEVMEEFTADTLAVDGRRQTIGKSYLVTIWNEGNYNLGLFPALYLDKNVVDTLYSRDSMRITVATFDIDLATDKPFDIKPLRKIPLKFGEFGGWLALALGAVALLAAGVWLLVRYRKLIPGSEGRREALPPHVEAIRRLESLRNQKLPQNGRYKQYYSGLADILREYLDARFGIGAMEMTSGEILDAVEEPKREGLIDEKRYGDLSGLLETADLVKFAKYTPDAADAEALWYSAYYFVEETKQQEL